MALMDSPNTSCDPPMTPTKVNAVAANESPSRERRRISIQTRKVINKQITAAQKCNDCVTICSHWNESSEGVSRTAADLNRSWALVSRAIRAAHSATVQRSEFGRSPRRSNGMRSQPRHQEDERILTIAWALLL